MVQMHDFMRTNKFMNKWIQGKLTLSFQFWNFSLDKTNKLIDTIIDNPFNLPRMAAVFASSMYLKVSWPKSSGMYLIDRHQIWQSFFFFLATEEVLNLSKSNVSKSMCFLPRGRMCQLHLDWIRSSRAITIGEQSVDANGTSMGIYDIPLNNPNLMLQIWVWFLAYIIYVT